LKEKPGGGGLPSASLFLSLQLQNVDTLAKKIMGWNPVKVIFNHKLYFYWIPDFKIPSG
jgi:hypothetical protein